MKSLRITLILTCIVIVFLSSGLVSAINSSDLTATPYWSTETPKIGETVVVRIMITNNLQQQVQILSIGVNLDWMNETQFYGKDLSSDPKNVPANGSYVCDPIMFQIPYTVTAGAHSYHIGVDGTDASGTDFSWDSSTLTIPVVGASSATPTPTPTATASGDGGGGTGSPQNWTLIIAGIAVAAIVVAVLFIVMEMRKKPKKAAPAVESPKPQAEKPKPAEDQPLKDIEE